ncbi:Rieske (2Fe-2S) protein [Microbulbifer agarilyticus]
MVNFRTAIIFSIFYAVSFVVYGESIIDENASPLTIDTSTFREGEARTYEWGGVPVVILKRSNVQVKFLEESKIDLERDFAGQFRPLDPPKILEDKRLLKDNDLVSKFRSRSKEYFVAIQLSTLEGCALIYQERPSSKFSEFQNTVLKMAGGAFYDPCTSALFDASGKPLLPVGSSIPSSLAIPPYGVNTQGRIIVGQ